jgi:hypothetical protein
MSFFSVFQLEPHCSGIERQSDKLPLPVSARDSVSDCIPRADIVFNTIFWLPLATHTHTHTHTHIYIYIYTHTHTHTHNTPWPPLPNC